MRVKYSLKGGWALARAPRARARSSPEPKNKPHKPSGGQPEQSADDDGEYDSLNGGPPRFPSGYSKIPGEVETLVPALRWSRAIRRPQIAAVGGLGQFFGTTCVGHWLAGLCEPVNGEPFADVPEQSACGAPD